jgi:hypothetical protein
MKKGIRLPKWNKFGKVILTRRNSMDGVIWSSIMIFWLIVMSVVGHKLKEDRVINGYLISGGILFPAIYLWQKYAYGFEKMGWFAYLVCFLCTGFILRITDRKMNKKESEINK